MAASPDADWMAPMKLILSAAQSACEAPASASHVRGQRGDDSDGQPAPPSGGKGSSPCSGEGVEGGMDNNKTQG
eukprot:scaffold11085_cov105-Isochrysis_galbana.AAC.2